MATAQRTKASDRQAVCKRVLKQLKKRFSGKYPKIDFPVLETMLFSACLEDSDWSDATDAFGRIHSQFHDLNDLRVSSVKETEALFLGKRDSQWQALRIRNILQYVFESTYSFEFEGLKRKTLDSAMKQLGEIQHMTPFMRAFTVQYSLGSHVLPIDRRMAAVLIWLGLADPGTTPKKVAELLKPAVRKADAVEFCSLIRCLATDPAFKTLFNPTKYLAGSQPYDWTDASSRLDQLLSGKAPSPKVRKAKRGSKTSRPRATKKKPAQSRTTKKPARKKTVKTRAASKKAVKRSSRTATSKKNSVNS